MIKLRKEVFQIIFVQVIFPILLVFSAGYLLQRRMKLDIRVVSTVAMYIFMPCLIFRTFYHTNLDLQYVYMLLFFIMLFVLLILISKIYVSIKGLPKHYESAYILSTAFMNTGNYGSPIILLAYGTIGFNYAISFFVIQSISMHTVGIYYASRGKLKMKDAIKKIYEMPMIYAVATVILLKTLHIKTPDNLLTVIDLLASACIPTVMIILGMQLAEIKLNDFEWGSITYSTIVRLVVSPVIAYLLTLVFPFDPLLAKVLILSSAMPSAVVAAMYAVQFDAKSELVSSTTIINTLASIGTITLLLYMLG